MNKDIKYLQHQIEKNGIMLLQPQKTVVIPFNGFLDKLFTSMKQYITKCFHCGSWAEYLVTSNNKRNISNILASWLIYNQKSIQTKLISTLLTCRIAEKLQMFLKLRKFVLKSTKKTFTSLDQIVLDHADIIGVLHSTFTDEEIKKKLLKGIKNILISYKIQQAKIQSNIFIQYVLSQFENIYEDQNFQVILTKARERKQKQQVKEVQENNFKSNLHEENGLYRKVKANIRNYDKISNMDTHKSDQSNKLKKIRNFEKQEDKTNAFEAIQCHNRTQQESSATIAKKIYEKYNKNERQIPVKQSSENQQQIKQSYPVKKAKIANNFQTNQQTSPFLNERYTNQNQYKKTKSFHERVKTQYNHSSFNKTNQQKYNLFNQKFYGNNNKQTYFRQKLLNNNNQIPFDKYPKYEQLKRSIGCIRRKNI